MHPSLRVNGRLAVPVVSVVAGFRFGWGLAAEAVHEPAGVVPVDPGGGDVFQAGQGSDRAGPEGRVAASALGLVQAHRRLGQGIVVGVPDGADRGGHPGQQLLPLAGRQSRRVTRPPRRLPFCLRPRIALPVQRRPWLADQPAGGLYRQQKLQLRHRLADHLPGLVPESALSESISKSACAFPATSSAALARASSLASFSFSFRSRSFSTSAWLRDGRPAGFSESAVSAPLSRAARQYSIWE